jgi:ribonuclease P protein component
MPRNVLRSPWQFRLVYEHGKKVNCRHAVLFYYRSGEAEPRRMFGVVASKRVGGAVERNRARRLLREAVRGTADRLVQEDLWVVLVAKRSILGCSSREILSDIEAGWVGEGMIQGPVSH